MAQAALSYQQPLRQPRELEQPQRPPLRVLPGRDPNAPAAPAKERQPAITPLWRTLFTLGLTALLAFGSVAVLRVGLAGATMEMRADSQQLTQYIELERSEGSRLEREFAAAANPLVIQEAAAQLGMSPDTQVENLGINLKE